MRVLPEDIVALANFPLLWRWTQESHAKFTPDELTLIRPICATKAEAICAHVVSNAAEPVRAEDRIDSNSNTAALVVRKWLDERIPGGEDEVLLLWDHKTAALVSRRLFVDRWDDFWYPSSDDLTVMGIVGAWRIEMYHHGVFDFSASGAGEQGVVAPLVGR